MLFFILSCSNVDQIPEKTESIQDITPVIIIGGGASGLTVGMRLLELGISPILLEKENELGGAGIHAGRFFAVNTRLQQERNIIDSSESALNEWTEINKSIIMKTPTLSPLFECDNITRLEYAPILSVQNMNKKMINLIWDMSVDPNIERYKQINPLDLDNNRAIGVVFPFDAEAVFHSSYTTKEQIKSNLINVLLTEPGERVMEPDFGVGLKLLLFEQNIDKDGIKSKIQAQVNLYIPEIEVSEINVNFVPDDHVLFIQLTYKFLLDESLDSIQLNFNNK